jgi:dienelactone hydrolase
MSALTHNADGCPEVAVSAAPTGVGTVSPAGERSGGADPSATAEPFTRAGTEPMATTRRQFLAKSAGAATAATFTGLSLGRAIGAVADATKDVPWLAEVQTPPATPPADTPKLSPLLADADGRPVTTLAAWQRRRDELRKWWLDFLGPVKADRTPPKLEVIEEDRPEGVVRQLVRYESEPGTPIEAYLLRPAKLSGKGPGLPGVLVLHSTVDHSIRQPAGLEGPPEKWFGLRLAQKGCVTFCPKNFLWVGKGGYRAIAQHWLDAHPGSRGMAKMLFDARRGLDVLASLPGVDADRLGAVGHSLGAKEVLYLAAFDERCKVAVSSEGGVGTRFSNWQDIWYLGDDVRKPDFTHEQHELLALAAPRPFLLLGGDSADGARSWPFIEAALPVYRLYAPDRRPRLGLFNHGKGHAVPPEAERRIYEWLLTYLAAG